MKHLEVAFEISARDADIFSDFLWSQTGVLGVEERPASGEAFFSPQGGFEVLEFGSAAAERCADYLEAEKFRGDARLRILVYLATGQDKWLSSLSQQSPVPAKLLSKQEKLSENYLKNYQDSVRGISFGKKLWVGPPWDKAPAKKEAFYVEPGLAFGTGDHPTTQICLEFLAAKVQKKTAIPERILDIGTGSGILAVAARRFFPKAKLYLCDLDPLCQAEVKKTFALNKESLKGVQQSFGTAGYLAELVEKGLKFPLIVSNIYGEVLADLSGQVEELLEKKKSSQWMVSGILAGEPEKLFLRTIKGRFEILERESRKSASSKVEKWVGLRLSLKA